MKLLAKNGTLIVSVCRNTEGLLKIMMSQLKWRQKSKILIDKINLYHTAPMRRYLNYNANYGSEMI